MQFRLSMESGGTAAETGGTPVSSCSAAETSPEQIEIGAALDEVVR